MPFKKGQGGRPRGAGNKSTPEIKSVLDRLAVEGKKDKHLLRLHQLTLDDDPHVSVKALSVVLAYRFGKPKESIEHSGEVVMTPTKVLFELHQS